MNAFVKKTASSRHWFSKKKGNVWLDQERFPFDNHLGSPAVTFQSNFASSPPKPLCYSLSPLVESIYSSTKVESKVLIQCSNDHKIKCGYIFAE